jgi:hypothetical protein
MEEIWFKNISVLFKKNNLTKFFPNEHMTKEEKLNSIVRYGLYLSILLFIYNNNINSFFILILLLGLTYFIYTNKSLNILGGNQKDNKKYTYSTEENPMKNILVNEMGTTKPPAYDNSLDEEEVKKNLNKKLYKSIADFNDDQHSQRQWFTMPNHIEGNFAKWLYDKPSCKSGDKETCVENIDYRYNFR